MYCNRGKSVSIHLSIPDLWSREKRLPVIVLGGVGKDELGADNVNNDKLDIQSIIEAANNDDVCECTAWEVAPYLLDRHLYRGLHR